MNAVIYARYSSDSQREESIEGQLRECREYAERNNMTIVGTYIDRALSAKTADRPEFQHMIKDSAKELFEIVLVWKLDRFSRDRYDSAHYKHILKKNGVKVISAKEHISEGPEGIILEAMLEGYAEFYSAELSEKIHRGQKENALKGKNNGGGVPLGYLLDKKAQKLVIDPTTAPLVVEVFEKYADGKSVRSIVEDFNARGLKTKRGQPFNINSFSSLLKNRKYIGEYRYQDVVIEGGVPAIVPEELFNRVQERMEKNRHAPAMAKAKEDYLLTTKLFCGKCERMMVGESGKSHTGAMHYYYKCSGAKRLKDCDKKAVRKDWIERVVVRLTMQRVMDEEKINRLIDAILVMQEQEDTTTPALRSQLAETESSIGNILKAIEQGIFTPSTKQRLDELEARKEEILVNIQTAELQKPKLTREQMAAWFEQFRHGDPANREFQKRLIDTFVNAVYVFDDKLVLTYNYQHGTQTISLEEIESALSSDFDGATPPKKKSTALQCSSFLVSPPQAAQPKGDLKCSGEVNLPSAKILLAQNTCTAQKRRFRYPRDISRSENACRAPLGAAAEVHPALSVRHGAFGIVFAVPANRALGRRAMRGLCRDRPVLPELPFAVHPCAAEALDAVAVCRRAQRQLCDLSCPVCRAEPASPLPGGYELLRRKYAVCRRVSRHGRQRGHPLGGSEPFDPGFLRRRLRAKGLLLREIQQKRRCRGTIYAA